MDNKRPIKSFLLPVSLILLAILLAWLGIAVVKNSISRSLSPIQQANQQLSTQVFQLLHPTPTVIPDPVTIINQIKAVARLQTIQYSVEKIITAEVNQGLLGPLFGDRLLFVAHGTVIAGIDMEKISATDLWLQTGMLYVRLPAAEVLVAELDNDRSYVYDRDTGLLTHGDPSLETIARQVAEQEILTAALNDGILAQAQVNAEIYLEKFFIALGYEKVVFAPSAP